MRCTTLALALAGMLTVAAAMPPLVGCDAPEPTPTPVQAVAAAAPADSLFEQADGLDNIAPAGAGLTLARGVLVHDDGAAFGLFDPQADPARPWRKDLDHPSESPYFEHLSLDVRAAKTLVAEAVAARSARLLIFAAYQRQQSPEPLTLSVNGHAARLAPPSFVPEPADADGVRIIPPMPVDPSKARVAGPRWWSVPVDPAWLVAGDNRVELRAAGGGWRIMIAPDGHRARGQAEPGPMASRSERSADGGKTWAADKLGPDGSAQGEYCVRLALDQFALSGKWTGPVTDLAADPGPIHRQVKLKSVRGRLATQTPAGTEIKWRIRTGGTDQPGRGWSNWIRLKVEPDGTFDLAKPRGRYAQLEAELTTEDPAVAPVLRAVELTGEGVEATAPPPGEIRVIEYDPTPLLTSTIEFGQPALGDAKLAALARRAGVATVVKNCRTQFEEAVKLAGRSAYIGRSGLFLPDWKWNAADIMGTKLAGPSQSLPYQVLLCELLQSRGLVARVVMFAPPASPSTTLGAGGRAMCEFWSNDYRKWVLLDGQSGRYFVDRRTAWPLGATELQTRAALPGGPDLVVIENGKSLPADTPLGDWPGGTLLLVPRSDFITADAPVPLSAGWTQEGWTGYVAWAGPGAAASELFPHRVSRPRDFNWPLNQVRIELLYGDKPGELRVRLATQTPALDGFMVSVNDLEWKPWPADFRWQLAPGPNCLRARVKNKAAALGPVYQVCVNFVPPT